VLFALTTAEVLTGFSFVTLGRWDAWRLASTVMAASVGRVWEAAREVRVLRVRRVRKGWTELTVGAREMRGAIRATGASERMLAL
jgi:hypothetical protein